jgi:hypothetical protein
MGVLDAGHRCRVSHVFRSPDRWVTPAVEFQIIFDEKKAAIWPPFLCNPAANQGLKVVRPRTSQSCIPPRYHLILLAG